MGMAVVVVPIYYFVVVHENDYLRVVSNVDRTRFAVWRCQFVCVDIVRVPKNLSECLISEVDLVLVLCSGFCLLATFGFSLAVDENLMCCAKILRETFFVVFTVAVVWILVACGR